MADPRPDPDRGLALPPRRFGAPRLALFRALEGASRLLGGRAFYRWSQLRPGRLRVRHECVRIPGLAPGLRGLRLLQLSDVHAGVFLGRGDLEGAVAAARAFDPHLVCFTGDLVTRRWGEALLVLDDFARLRARLGAFGVFGNHDYHGRDEGRIAAAFEPLGWRFLRNEAVRFEVEGGALCLVGLEDPEEGRRVDPRAARRALRPGDVEVVLCHNPHVFPELVRPGCALVLSGHTHGGQVNLPAVRHLGPSHPGDRLRLGPTTLIVSTGLGALGVPLRVGAPAEVVAIELADDPRPRESPAGGGFRAG